MNDIEVNRLCFIFEFYSIKYIVVKCNYLLESICLKTNFSITALSNRTRLCFAITVKEEKKSIEKLSVT